VIVAHPGHELMIYHWIERHTPIYCCLTDGSGGRAASRVASTTRLLARVGATPGPVYARYADKAIYRLLIEKRVGVFVALAQELAEALIAAEIDGVAGDAVEGFNPVHDVCRILIDGAVAIARRRTGRDVANYEFGLDSSPAVALMAPKPGTEVLRLDAAALDRKMTAALEYPEMRGEVEAAVARFGRQAFAVEVLQPAGTTLMTARFEREAPGYEQSGARRVSEGVYSEIIRYRDHIQPVLHAMDLAG
jgi:AcrR family transcriptional regulator